MQVDCTTQVCSVCEKPVPIEKFVVRKETGRRRKDCTPCRNDRAQTQRNTKLYGISEEEYQRLFLLQGGKCAICGCDPEVRRLSVDHCHKTGRVRALLCRWCNMGIGSFREDPEIMRRAIAFLESF